jgi:hypothetical protein
MPSTRHSCVHRSTSVSSSSTSALLCAETAHLADDRFHLSASQSRRECFGDRTIAPVRAGRRGS